ncbi:MAG TPA: class I SAM-dependent methyltransferase, partial [Candidatus Brocadiia bacterium]|nr:class I SAM-dependent methyltransferase [Candidatus Brocadiia bacterium]
LASRNDPLRYFFYNSLVYRSRKTDAPAPKPLQWTGERFVPWVDDPTVALEHLHRYRLAQRAAAGRRVLDLACGEGYGSFLLSQTALAVTGLDLDAAAVRHATFRYRRPNLTYVTGSMLDIPLPGTGLFDLIVCFEALEHISDHNRLLAEVKRLLVPGGVFLVSTPHKEIYSGQSGYTNPFHVKELSFAEFRALLAKTFRNSTFMGQNVFAGSVIFPLESAAGPGVHGAIRRASGEYQHEELGASAARYFIAAASDAPLAPVVCPGQSGMFDLSALDHRPAEAAPEPPPTEPRLASGFHPDEGGWRWMDKTGCILIPPNLLPGRLGFRLTSSDLGHYDVFPFHVAVLLDGEELDKVRFDASQQDRDVALDIPAQTPPRVRVVELASSQSFVPASKGLGSDVRRLSVRFTGPAFETLEQTP